jgi:uncharacterized protein YjbJ (UPF0337 family)
MSPSEGSRAVGQFPVPPGNFDQAAVQAIATEETMNWDQVEGKWKQYRGKMKEKWGKLTDSDFDLIDGRRQILVGKIQEHYGIAKEAAEKQADEFVKALKEEDAAEDRARRAGTTS